MISHTFLCWGPRRAPEVHILTCDQVDQFVRLQMIDGTAPDGFANACTFGLGFDYAVPAVQQCMEQIALEYEGLFAERIKYLAACLALGKPIDPPSDDPGTPAYLIPTQPTQPPSGAVMRPSEAIAVN